MKVCPIQRYGMEPVMTHFVETGEILGKNTDNLEGYAFEDRGGYFGPGELPIFDSEFFEIPKGRSEDWLFDKFKEKVTENGGIDSESLSEVGADLSKIMEIEDSSRGDE